jgi:hypothetical protein
MGEEEGGVRVALGKVTKAEGRMNVRDKPTVERGICSLRVGFE